MSGVNIRKYPANAGNVGGTRAAGAIKYIVIHYTGNDGDTAANNAKYYAGNVVKTSAHYFIDEKEIVQSVDDLRVAWAVGGKKYPSCPQTGGGTLHGRCLNANSISIELCDEKKNGVYAPGAKTVAQALELTKALMKKYNIPASNVIRHFDVTGKLCPAYWSGRENAGKWEKEFKSRLVEPDYREVLKKRAGLLDPTLDYLAAYKYGADLISKLATMKQFARFGQNSKGCVQRGHSLIHDNIFDNKTVPKHSETAQKFPLRPYLLRQNFGCWENEKTLKLQ